MNTVLPDAPLVLLVEDYEANILVATLYLEMMGYRHEVARDGHEAVAKARTGIYDAILMDVRMPGIDGTEATHRIRELNIRAANRDCPVPIIGMTAQALIGDRERLMAFGMDDYISKPIEETLLRNKLAHYTR